MRRFIAIMFWLILLVGAVYVAVAQEQITLTTYYPAPYGVYEDMAVMNRLGVGIANPTRALEVHGTDDSLGYFYDTGLLGIVDIQAKFGEIGFYRAGGSPNFIFYASQGDTTTPTATSAGNFLGGLIFQGHTGARYRPGAIIQAVQDGAPGAFVPGAINFKTYTSAAGFDRMRITSSGNVGIGIASPNHLIELNGGAYCDGTGDWIAGSSRQLKKDIQPLQAKDYLAILNKLKHIEVIRYRYKNPAEDQRLRMGVISEDAPEEFVTSDKKGISPMDSIGFLLAAVKAQQQEIDELRQQINKLKR